MRLLPICILLLIVAVSLDASPAANRLTYLDEFCDLYYPNLRFPKLTTPQWIGETDVDAALILAIDDMRDSAKYEAYLRPILERLKEIDGRAPLSIMTCKVEPRDPQLQRWLSEGVSIEVHTMDHPCPILDKGNFLEAKGTYDRCVDLIASIPRNQPVAFRTPCMDGINSASPRLFSEILMNNAPSGRYLTIGSSIGQLLTPADREVSREFTTAAGGKPRFDKYLIPGWVNYVRDYPYPWVIGNRFWETGFCVPDDYQASLPNGNQSPSTIADMKASIDAVVAKKGLWVMTFHPYNWITNYQVADLIGYTAEKYGKRIKFLNFREAQERINKNLLADQPLRRADGGDNGVRLLDLNNDGYLDVIIGNDSLKQTRLWNPKRRRWETTDFPTVLTGARFGILQDNGYPSVLAVTAKSRGLWHFDGKRWRAQKNGTAGLVINGEPILGHGVEFDQGIRLRDFDGDGICELIVSNPKRQGVFRWDLKHERWQPLPFKWPNGISLVNDLGQDNGLRFVDINNDGAVDLIFSNENEYGVWLYSTESTGAEGFSRELLRGHRDEGDTGLPMIVRRGEFRNNGAFFSSDSLLIQNEDTGKLPDLLQRVPFKTFLETSAAPTSR